MDNLSTLSENEWQAHWQAWGEIAQNRAKFACFPNAAVVGRAMIKEWLRRNPRREYKPVYSPSGRGGYLRLLAACGDSTYAHYYDSRRR